MNKPLKIAIYSGEIPSTTFVERLAVGLSKHNNILLFGIKKRHNKYPKSISVYGYKNNRFSKALHLLKYSLLLVLFKNKEKRILDVLLKSQDRDTLNEKLKSYPVLFYKPDIFHIQWAKSIEDWIWVKEFGMKLVLSLRGAHINYSPIVDEKLAATYKKLFTKVSAFHAVSIAIAKESTKYNVEVEHVKVIKSGLDLDNFSFKLKTFDSNQPLKIISVGRDHWIKNYKLALDAMFELKQHGIKFHYKIIGIKNNEALIYQRAQLELENEVSFVNTMSFKNVQKEIQQADVMLLSSLKEGIANVVLEAMALGTFVVSTNSGGMAKVVIPNQTGLLVPLQDVQAMCEKLIEVSKLAMIDYQRITEQARAFVENNHNEKQMILDMQFLYENLKR
ncbi:glycosyltransferase family 4 protein [Winogradskyella sp. R77965]|uniref:glycosyltransferase family 4 protein n=1 Tax=Winogradskyella sp. R77965 TaxID=3093872 RepID=UPI0037DD3E5A